MSELTPGQAIEILKRASATECTPIFYDCAGAIQKLQEQMATLCQKAETYKAVLSEISKERCRCNPLLNPCAGCLAKQILANAP